MGSSSPRRRLSSASHSTARVSETRTGFVDPAKEVVEALVPYRMEEDEFGACRQLFVVHVAPLLSGTDEPERNAQDFCCRGVWGEVTMRGEEPRCARRARLTRRRQPHPPTPILSLKTLHPPRPTPTPRPRLDRIRIQLGGDGVDTVQGPSEYEHRVEVERGQGVYLLAATLEGCVGGEGSYQSTIGRRRVRLLC